MVLENGTLILADYTAKLKDTGQIIETTRREDAEKAGNFDPTRTYEPRLIAVGEGWVLKGLDEALQAADPGQTLDVELGPDKAFGVRDPNRVSRIPLRKFGEKAFDLTVGSDVEVDNRVGIVRSLESGRALIDFNHRYAGKTLDYSVSIKEKLDSRDSKIEALVRRRLPVEREKLKFEPNADAELKIFLPNDVYLLEGLQIIKRGISTDLFKFAKPLAKVLFVEEYEDPTRRKAEEAEQKKQQEEQAVEGEESLKTPAATDPETKEQARLEPTIGGGQEVEKAAEDEEEGEKESEKLEAPSSSSSTATQGRPKKSKSTGAKNSGRKKKKVG